MSIEDKIRSVSAFTTQLKVELKSKEPSLENWADILKRLSPYVESVRMQEQTPAVPRGFLLKQWDQIQNRSTATVDNCGVMCLSYEQFMNYFSKDKPTSIKGYLAEKQYDKAVAYLWHCYEIVTFPVFQPQLKWVADALRQLPFAELVKASVCLCNQYDTQSEVILLFIQYWLAGPLNPELHSFIVMQLKRTPISTEKQKEICKPIVDMLCESYEKFKETAILLEQQLPVEFSDAVKKRAIALAHDPNSNKLFSFVSSLHRDTLQDRALIAAVQEYLPLQRPDLAEMATQKINFLDLKTACEGLIVNYYAKIDLAKVFEYLETLQDPDKKEKHCIHLINLLLREGKIPQAIQVFKQLKQPNVLVIKAIMSADENLVHLDQTIDAAAQKIKNPDQRKDLAIILFLLGQEKTINCAYKLGNFVDHATQFLAQQPDDFPLRTARILQACAALEKYKDKRELAKMTPLLCSVPATPFRDQTIYSTTVILNIEFPRESNQLIESIGDGIIKRKARTQYYFDQGQYERAYDESKTLPEDIKTELSPSLFPKLLGNQLIAYAEDVLGYIEDPLTKDIYTQDLIVVLLSKNELERAYAYILKVQNPHGFIFLIASHAYVHLQTTKVLPEKFCKKYDKSLNDYAVGITQLNGILTAIAPQVPHRYVFIPQYPIRVIRALVDLLIKDKIIPPGDKHKFETVIRTILEPNSKQIQHLLESLPARIKHFGAESPTGQVLTSLFHPGLTAINELLKLGRVKDACSLLILARSPEEENLCIDALFKFLNAHKEQPFNLIDQYLNVGISLKEVPECLIKKTLSRFIRDNDSVYAEQLARDYYPNPDEVLLKIGKVMKERSKKLEER